VSALEIEQAKAASDAEFRAAQGKRACSDCEKFKQEQAKSAAPASASTEDAAKSSSEDLLAAHMAAQEAEREAKRARKIAR